MNVFGVDVSRVDLAELFTLVRLASLAVVLLAAVFYYRSRRLSVLGVALVALVVIDWAGAIYPLERPYGMEFPGDRLRNVTWVTSVAAGNSPLSTGRVGELSLEPFWALFAGSLLFGHPEQVGLLYALLSLAVKLGLGASLFLHFRRGGAPGETRTALGLTVAASVLLFATGPLDFLQPYRAFDAKVFLLKPNHALGLVLLPVAVGLVAREGRRRLAATALLLALLGWVFIIHWAFFCFALGLYLALTFWKDREAFPGRLRSVLLLWVASALLVAPYFWLIYQQHPYAISLATVDYPDAPTRSIWGDMLPTGTSLSLLVTLDRGLLFALGLVGLLGWLKRSGPRELLWSALLLGSYLLWAINYVGYLTARAREADEFYYFLVFNLAVAAGNGAYRIGERALEIARRSAGPVLPLAYVSIALLVASAVHPTWWHPERMDGHFRLGLEPIPGEILEVRDWVLRETDGEDVFLSDGEMSFWVAALTGRQILSAKSAPHVVDDVLSGAALPELGVTHVLFTPEMVGILEMHPETLGRRPRFQRVFHNPRVSIYRIAG